MKTQKTLHATSAFDIASVLLVAAFAIPSPAAAGGAQMLASTQAAAAGGLASQVDRGGGVTVKVTPRELGSKAAAWVFAVVLDTHSQELSQDLTRVAALVDAQGRRHAPLAWEGAGPGGHHRQGVLKFKPLDEATGAVVLEISDIGGVPLRTFRWQIER